MRGELDQERIWSIIHKLPDDHPELDPSGIGCVDRSRYWDLALSPDFTHRIVEGFYRIGKQPPPWMLDSWMHRLRCRYARAGSDLEMEQILGLSQSRHNFMALLKAYLLQVETDLATIATKLNLPEKVIEGYHHLFFNVRGRTGDPLFMNHLLYPDGRKAEYEPEYRPSQDFERVLLRCVYHNDFAAFFYLAGYTKRPPEMDSTSALLLVESLIMNNAVLAADHMGGMQQRSNVGFNNAKSILSSAKIGGQTASETEDPMLGSDELAAQIKNDLFSLENY